MIDFGIPETAEIHPTNHHKPMKVSIKFSTDNAAFEDHPDEIGRILREIGEAIELWGIFDGPCEDRNGNKIGTWSYR